MTNQEYIFNHKTKKPEPVDLMTWAVWFEDPKNKRIALDIKNGVEVSTVFLGLNHNFSQNGPPLLFETMVFGTKTGDDPQDRYATYDEAIAGHKAMVKKYL